MDIRHRNKYVIFLHFLKVCPDYDVQIFRKGVRDWRNAARFYHSGEEMGQFSAYGEAKLMITLNRKDFLFHR